MLWCLTLSQLAVWSASCSRSFPPKWYEHLQCDSDIIYDVNDFVLICISLYLFIKQYPDYYAIIKEPIDLKIITQKIQVCYFTSF